MTAKKCFALTALTLGISFAAQAEALKVGYLPATGHAKLFIAQEQGLFKAEGLEVELVEFINSADITNAILANKLDIGAPGATAPLANLAKGSPLKILGSAHGQDATLIARADQAERIRNLQDLKGLKIATVRASGGDAVLRGSLHKQGLSWKEDVSLFELKNPPAVIEAVKSGQVDAGVVWGPHDVRAESQGLKVVIRSGELEPGHICCVLLVTEQSLQQSPKVWEKFLRATLKAEKFLREQHKASIEAIAKYIKIDPELLEKSTYQANNDHSSDPNLKGVKSFWANLQASEFVSGTGEAIPNAVEIQLYAKVLNQLASENPKDPFWQKLQADYQRKDVL